MTEKEKKIYVRWLKAAYGFANDLCKKNKDLDRGSIVQTLLMLQLSPAQRLSRAFLRAGKIKPY